jgi:hypothetical protein
MILLAERVLYTGAQVKVGTFEPAAQFKTRL